jgi:hypothetical protein
MVAGYVNAERTTPALAASDLSVPVLTPLVVEFEITCTYAKSFIDISI